MHPKIDWRNRSNVGFNKRLVGFYESSEEILACPHNCDAALVGRFNRFIAGFSCGAIYLHIILNSEYHIYSNLRRNTPSQDAISRLTHNLLCKFILLIYIYLFFFKIYTRKYTRKMIYYCPLQD
jgi:hypothetical protein